jgi:hypothetical protein
MSNVDTPRIVAKSGKSEDALAGFLAVRVLLLGFLATTFFTRFLAALDLRMPVFAVFFFAIENTPNDCPCDVQL